MNISDNQLIGELPLLPKSMLLLDASFNKLSGALPKDLGVGRPAALLLHFPPALQGAAQASWRACVRRLAWPGPALPGSQLPDQCGPVLPPPPRGCSSPTSPKTS
jgi:hypothetical protein